VTAVRPRARSRSRVALLSATCITACVLELLGFFEVVLTNPGAGSTPASPAVLVGVTIPIVISTVAVGAVLVNRLPRHVMGWFLLAAGLSLAVSTGAGGLADYGLNVRPGSVPGAIGFAIVSGAVGGPFIGLLAGFVPLYFPTGRLPSPRWWPVVVIAIIPTLSPVITNLFGPFPAGTYPPAATNPLALEGVGGLLVQVLGGVSTVLGVVGLACAIASLIVRYRRAQGAERAQLKWFAYLGLVVVPTLVLAIVTGGATTGPLAVVTNIAWAAALLGLAFLPVTIGLAILRYRLYEIDRIISRTLAYGVVTAVLATVFVAVVLGLQTVLSTVTQANTLAVAGSTVLVATLFQPLRARVQRAADRRFNRSRYDAERTVAAFAERLRDVVGAVALRDELSAAVDGSVQPIRLGVWLRAVGGDGPGARNVLNEPVSRSS